MSFAENMLAEQQKRDAEIAKTIVPYHKILADRDRLAAELQAVTEDRDRLKPALEFLLDTHGMHGPCKNHSCRDCKAAVNKATDALHQSNQAMAAGVAEHQRRKGEGR